jgi:hypothetical protein
MIFSMVIARDHRPSPGGIPGRDHPRFEVSQYFRAAASLSSASNEHVLEHPLRPIVIPSLSFMFAAVCIAPLLLYCAALWIDS